MEINKITFQGKEKKEKKQHNVGASILATTASQVLPSASLVVGVPALNKMSKISLSLSKDEVEIINNAADSILKNKGLADKGVQIINLKPQTNITNMPDKILELIDPYFATSRGKNAFFTDKALMNVPKNCIGINKEKLSLAVFHEMGHAHNYNFSKFWKAMQKLRMPGMALAVGLGVFAAITKKSKPKKENGELTKGQKVKDGIRNNAGKLAFLSMVPMLLEEGMASIKGCKFAKEMLSKDLFKKVVKTNCVAYTSYLAAAVGLGLAAFGARKIKDKLVERKEAKLQAKMNIKNS